MDWGIIGAGLIGGKRAEALQSLGEKVAAVADVDLKRAEGLASKYGATSFSDWKKITRGRGIGAVAVATTHDALSEISCDALAHAKHVLVEKPAGRNPKEVLSIIAAQKKSGRQAAVGFNHRFHPAIAEARRICESRKFGRLLYMRARYGHGGRPGYEKEWRFDPEISGGGQLIDQGSHLIDLSRFFAGEEFALKFAACRNYFWHAPAEDTASLFLESGSGVSSLLSTSCVQWKNLFSFELFFERAQVNIDGLGRSYGTETLTIHRMKPEMGPPESEVKKFESEDQSFKAEAADFLSRIGGGPSVGATLEDALASMLLIAESYKKKK
ncbi:D-xylose 1-dehydrogenase (NADP(+)) 2 [uncultured archaeon]|nr:D-xylose 1-dehydrogenase (NADP(+)) 2 [uncultured archaeon]